MAVTHLKCDSSDDRKEDLCVQMCASVETCVAGNSNDVTLIKKKK